MSRTYPYLILLALLGITFATACDDDDDVLEGDVETTIDFRAEWNGNPLAILRETYPYGADDNVNPQLFQYYVSDLELLPADGSAPVQISDIELIRYNSATDDEIESRTYTVPAGNYAGLRFGLGVSPDLNAIDPSNFAANDPLNENEFWNATARYVFAKIEANTDLDGNPDFESNLTLHMGDDSLYEIVEFNQPFTLNGSGSPRLTVVADVFSALASGTAFYDINDPALQRVHGGNQEAAAGVFSRLAGTMELEIR